MNSLEIVEGEMVTIYLREPDLGNKLNWVYGKYEGMVEDNRGVQIHCIEEQTKDNSPAKKVLVYADNVSFIRTEKSGIRAINEVDKSVVTKEIK